ncbi:MAG TPA: hypothetical protein VNT22_06425 [Baekduia sp.]|nr:hypothetical protein [Baekduia sp.]
MALLVLSVVILLVILFIVFGTGLVAGLVDQYKAKHGEPPTPISDMSRDVPHADDPADLAQRRNDS